ncbi:tetratricopeptide repeat protein [Terrihabitans sp. B22-R8]|uniref:tetratricopeptide repeat protein n=1 Tax=Terrihabitans sp. B22-R8 TaxID=3425128 RepID=UPI00403CF508
MSDIFNEIERDIRSEQLSRLWRRFGPLAIGVAILIVVGVGGWRYWEHHQAQAAQEAGRRYAAALDLARENKHSEAEAALRAIAADGPEGYQTLARFRAAAELAATDPAGALGAFEAIAQAANVPPLLRDMARIRAGYIMVDTGSAADVASRVEVLAAPGGAWRHSARELLALAAWKAGDIAETQRWAQEAIADMEAPTGIRTRVQFLLDLASGADRADLVTPPAAEQPAEQSEPQDAPMAAQPDSTVPEAAKPANGDEEPVAESSEGSIDDAAAPAAPADPALPESAPATPTQ